ncbi:MAG: CopG family transcriptional regulator [Candidatus Thiodiazotropha endolucinida]
MNNQKVSKRMKRVSLTVDPGDYSAIEQLAQRSNVSASWLIRRSMREFLERHGSNDHLEIPFDKEAKK